MRTQIQIAKKIFLLLKRIYSNPTVKNYVNKSVINFINKKKNFLISALILILVLICCCSIIFLQFTIGIFNVTNNLLQTFSSNINFSLLNIFDNQRSNYYKVIEVIDGDTIVVITPTAEKQKIRLIGIDTPEVDPNKGGIECYGPEASNKAKEMLLNKWIILENDETQADKDKYDRYLRYVFIPEDQNNYSDNTNNKIFFNKYMLENGYAFEFTYGKAYKYQKEFKEAQNYAMQNKKGLWNPQNCHYIK